MAALRHAFLITFSLASVFLFSGCIFGWSSFESILLSERRFYSAYCDADALLLPCEEQQLALNRAFTIASTAVSVVALPAGWFIDEYGPMAGLTLAGVLQLIGLTGIAICEKIGSVEVDVFLWSLVTIAVAGSLCMFCGYSMPFLFPKRATLLMSATSCLFDASSIIFPLMRAIYDAGIVDFKSLLWYAVALAAVVYSLLICAWWLCRDDLAASRATTAASDDSSRAESGATAHEHAGGGGSCHLSALPFGRQLRSLEFACICVYSAVHVARSNLYLGTVGIVNHGVATASGATKVEEDTALTAIGVIIPFGFIAIPLIDGCVAWLGLIGTLHVTSALGLLYNGLQLYPSLLAQYAAAAVFAIFRAFLFSIVSSYNMETFGPLTMGRVMGLCFIAAALCNLAQIPLIDMSVSELRGDCTPMLLIVLVASTPLPLGWVVISLRERWWQPKTSSSAFASSSSSSSREQPLLPKSSASLSGGAGGGTTGAVLGPWSGPAVRKADVLVAA